MITEEPLIFSTRPIGYTVHCKYRYYLYARFRRLFNLILSCICVLIVPLRRGRLSCSNYQACVSAELEYYVYYSTDYSHCLVEARRNNNRFEGQALIWDNRLRSEGAQAIAYVLTITDVNI